MGYAESKQKNKKKEFVEQEEKGTSFIEQDIGTPTI